MRNRIMILCTFCAIAIFSSAQEKFSIRGIANEELNNQSQRSRFGQYNSGKR